MIVRLSDQAPQPLLVGSYFFGRCSSWRIRVRLGTLTSNRMPTPTTPAAQPHISVAPRHQSRPRPGSLESCEEGRRNIHAVSATALIPTFAGKPWSRGADWLLRNATNFCREPILVCQRACNRDASGCASVYGWLESGFEDEMGMERDL